MKNKQQLITAAIFWLGGFLIGMAFVGLAQLPVEGEWFKGLMIVIAGLAFMIPVPMSLWALVYSFWQFYKLGKGDDVQERKRRIHYTLPLAFPVASTGFSLLGVVMAIAWFYAIYKWARPYYDKEQMKAILFHRGNVSWGRCLLTWINVLFFVFATIIPLVMVALILFVINAFVSSGSRGGSSSGSDSDGSSGDSFRSCGNCAYYSSADECPYTHSHMNPSDSCSNFKHHMS